MPTTGESTTRLTATELWDYFQENLEDLRKSEHMIASDPAWSTEIYITAYDDSDFAEIKVYIGDKMVDSELCFDEDTCAFTFNEYVRDYLSPLIPKLGDYDIPDEVSYDPDEDEDALNILEDQAYEARDNLRMAFYDFIVACTGDEDYNVEANHDSDTIGEMMGLILETLGSDYGVPVYYPMVIETENGKEVVKYPYGR